MKHLVEGQIGKMGGCGIPHERSTLKVDSFVLSLLSTCMFSASHAAQAK